MGQQAHPEHSHHAPHPVDEKSTRNMVCLSLALFFVMGVVGHFVFVAGGHGTDTGHKTTYAAPHAVMPEDEAENTTSKTDESGEAHTPAEESE